MIYHCITTYCILAGGFHYKFIFSWSEEEQEPELKLRQSQKSLVLMPWVSWDH